MVEKMGNLQKRVRPLIKGLVFDTILAEGKLEMKRRSGRIAATAFIMSAALAAALSASAAKSRVVVLHTNDTHTHIDDGLVAFSEIAAEKARLEAEGENVILVDAGDYVQGTALGGFDAGKSVFGIHNSLTDQLKCFIHIALVRNIEFEQY